MDSVRMHFHNAYSSGIFIPTKIFLFLKVENQASVVLVNLYRYLVNIFSISTYGCYLYILLDLGNRLDFIFFQYPRRPPIKNKICSSGFFTLYAIEIDRNTNEYILV